MPKQQPPNPSHSNPPLSEEEILNSPIEEVIDSLAHLHGHFVLTSGKTSTEYFDSRRVSLHPTANRRMVDELIDRLHDIHEDRGPITAIGGPESASLPIIGALLPRIPHFPPVCSIHGFYVRKARKDHGTGKRIEGYLEKGDRVVIIEDVVTTGGSVLDSIHIVEEAGATVLGILCLINRPEEKLPKLEAYPIHALLDLTKGG